MAQIGGTTQTVVAETSDELQSFPWHQIDQNQGTRSIFLLSDDQLFRAGCEYLLSSAESVDLRVSVAPVDRTQAMRALDEVAPDAVIIGVRQLKQDTLDLLTSLREARPQTGFILVFAWAGQRVIQDLRTISSKAQGGFACVSRDSVASEQHLLQLIEAVTAGRVLLDPALLDRFLAPESAGNPVTARLSNREGEVLHLMATGLTNPGIAHALCLERKAVERHINSIYTKLGDKAGEGHPRVNTILAYLEASGRLDGEAA
ncbi:MAG: response regulator transcription factor [Chloroflexi bacterium]|nr:response regulator transcription factor [Chloroflexota bacterium]